MVFRDYLVRCKRCKVPYIPKNVSRIKTCIFCRKSLIEGKSERLNLLKSDVGVYFVTQGMMPTDNIIKSWIKLKFELSDKRVNEYFSYLKKTNVLTVSKKEKVASVSTALNA